MLLGIGNLLQGQDAAQQTDFPGLDVQGVIGFDKCITRSSPLSAAFLITNNSEKMLEGELVLRDLEGNKSVSLGAVAVGPGGKKRISTVQAFDGWTDVEAEYTDGFQSFWKRRLFVDNERAVSEQDSLLLVVDVGSRKLVFPKSSESVEEAENVTSDLPVFVPQIGRGNRVLAPSIPEWQIPIHPGPLSVIRAIAFSESAKVESVGDAQWEAVGQWICFGGHVFVPESSPQIVEKLKSVCPLPVQPPSLRHEMTTYVAGLGSIMIYSGELFKTDATQAALNVALCTSKLSGISIYKSIGERRLAFPSEGKSYQTRNWVILVFSVYTLIAGGVTLMLFRLSRRRLKAFVVTVVGVTCIASGVLGLVLRTSLGDATIVTVTELADVGAVQIAKIDVQSAGGRNFNLGITANKPDLQLVEDTAGRRSNPYGPVYPYGDYYRIQDTSHVAPPFSIAENQSTDKSDGAMIRIPVQPWGQRSCMATSCLPNLNGLKVELDYQVFAGAEKLKFESLDDVRQSLANHGLSSQLILNGNWTANVENNTGLEVDTLTLVLSQSVVAGQDGNRRSFDLTQIRKSEFELIPIYTQSRIGVLKPVPAADGTAKSTQFQASPVEWTGSRSPYGGFETLVSTTAPGGSTFVRVIGTLRKSPGISMDEAQSDFRPSSVEVHVVSLYIPEERLPATWRLCHQGILDEQIAVEKAQVKEHFEILRRNQQNP